MNILNSISFMIFGFIMRFMPVFAPMFVAPGAADVAAAEASTRGMLLVILGWLFVAIGSWFFLKEVTHRGALALSRFRLHLQTVRTTRAIAQARKARVRALVSQVTVRVQY